MTKKETTVKLMLIAGLFALLLFLMAGRSIFSRPSRAENVSEQANTVSGSSITTQPVRAVWICFGDYKSAGLYNKSKAVFTSHANAYFKKLKRDGINTIYFHVVPCNDAIYPSNTLKWSKYMFSSAPDYDPLEILVQAAHKQNMSFHAWINPYRKKMGVIYDPGKQSSLNRIVRIVREIIYNYDVDGIHFDDYFYPSRARGAQLWRVPVAKRKRVINKMVRTVYRTVKTEDKNLLFGISPAGNTDYAESLGCDLKTWMSSKGYIDYIVPQIYWSDAYRMNGRVQTLYTNRLKKWRTWNKADIPMYIGLALYRAGSYSSTDLGWKRRSNNIVSQIHKAKEKNCDGYVLFSSTYMYSRRTKREMKNYRTYIKNHKSW